VVAVMITDEDDILLLTNLLHICRISTTSNAALLAFLLVSVLLALLSKALALALLSKALA
jgi:hypothetical protein